MIGPEEHKYGCTKVKVVRELPAWQAFGPNGEAVAALIERCKTLTYDAAAWTAARALTSEPAYWAASCAAFDLLYGPWAFAMES
jgi:hypothetical protein